MVVHVGILTIVSLIFFDSRLIAEIFHKLVEYFFSILHRNTVAEREKSNVNAEPTSTNCVKGKPHAGSNQNRLL